MEIEKLEEKLPNEETMSDYDCSWLEQYGITYEMVFGFEREWTWYLPLNG